MEIDLAQLESNPSAASELRAEICIIGGGIAGLTLAHRLLQLGHDVLLLEAGGHTPGAHVPSAALLQTGDPHPGTSEPPLHALGGTSFTWGGQLLPLPHDTTWSVPSSELDRYAVAAERLLHVDDLPYDASAFFTRLQQRVPALLQQAPQLTSVLSKFAPFASRNLGHTLAPALRSHSKARILLHARATELLLSDSRDSIEAVLIRAPSGRELRIEAAQFVVAAGSLETVCLLLASRSVAPQGLGNQHDQVGRNFHDHLTITAATFHGDARSTALAALRPWVIGETVHSLKLLPSSELQTQLHLTPVMAHLTIAEPEDSGIAALRRYLRARQQSHLSRELSQLYTQLPRALWDAAHLAWSARVKRRRYVSRNANVLLRLNAAQHTPSASRITLSSELDTIGQPKPALHWRIEPQELATLRSFTAHLQQVFERTLPAGVQWDPALIDGAPDAPIPGLDDARHAMGGASMGNDPRTSVVTPELRVHGIRNLFVASAAVFPDGSPQLPTLPLMALALRLADHLDQQP